MVTGSFFPWLHYMLMYKSTNRLFYLEGIVYLLFCDCMNRLNKSRGFILKKINVLF